MTPRTEAGFTLVEASICMVVLAPILIAILAIPKFLFGSVAATTAAASVDQRAAMIHTRLAACLRPASLSRLEVRGSMGWTAPVDGPVYDGIRFQQVAGLPTQSSTPLTPVRALEFELSHGEVANGRDDDGDGVIDDGQIRLVDTDGTRVTLAASVELFRLIKRGRTLEAHVQVAGRDRNGRIARRTFRLEILLRNN